MKKEDVFELAGELGYAGQGNSVYDLRDWLREIHQIHVEVGSIWDEFNNKVEANYYTITAPVNVYYFEPRYESRRESHREMLFSGVAEALFLLKQYKLQQHKKVTDDQLVIAYLKGYGNKKGSSGNPPVYRTNIENYAYQLGKQGDYIKDGLTDEDIVLQVRNYSPDSELLSLKE